MKYWIGVVSRDHVQRGVSLGIMQLGHGKRGPLARLRAGDGFIYYSPRISLQDGGPLQAFTAIGRVTDDESWQADEGTFRPWRRRVTYARAEEASIRPLLPQLSITKDKPSWGYVFRYGLVEISEQDFQRIASAMNATA